MFTRPDRITAHKGRKIYTNLVLLEAMEHVKSPVLPCTCWDSYPTVCSHLQHLFALLELARQEGWQKFLCMLS